MEKRDEENCAVDAIVATSEPQVPKPTTKKPEGGKKKKKKRTRKKIARSKWARQMRSFLATPAREARKLSFTHQ
jgi:hypothetical protein